MPGSAAATSAGSSHWHILGSDGTVAVTAGRGRTGGPAGDTSSANRGGFEIGPQIPQRKSRQVEDLAAELGSLLRSGEITACATKTERVLAAGVAMTARLGNAISGNSLTPRVFVNLQPSTARTGREAAESTLP